MYESNVLHQYIHDQKIEEQLSKKIGENVTLKPSGIECLKSTKRSTIYKLLFQRDTATYPIILKIYGIGKYKNQVEINVYSDPPPLLNMFLPQIYHIENRTSHSEIWIFMEFIQHIRGRVIFTPQHFDYIIPGIAKLHAHTFEDQFMNRYKDLPSWFPVYNSKTMRKERSRTIKDTIQLLNKAAKDKDIKSLIQPHYAPLMKIYENQPDFFPELLGSGSAVTHSDLHMQNVCCKNLTEAKPWDIQLIDWESTKFGPVWFDMVVLVEILLAFRKDWQNEAEDIRTHCVNLYTTEMKKHGIEFQHPPLDLYKMAYLQRTLEKGLYMQLRRIFSGRGGELLPYHLEKVATWGKELGIYQ
ncbi:MAG TPA: oxidoreductase family protein [Chondromyces sp.]|nr:oxidoreductase family protein [Chondromyces sp.]